MFDKYITNLLVKKVFTFEDDKIMMMRKVPFVMYPARAKAVFIQKVTKDLGDEFAKRIAYGAGDISSKELTKKLEWTKHPIPYKIATMRKMFELMGFGNFDVKIWNTKSDKVLINVTKLPTIEWGIKLFGADEKLCQWYIEVYSAHIHGEFGVENCHLIETQCMSKGAKFCEWSFNVFKK